MTASSNKRIRMVAGLGNPGEEYVDTRHNAGFQTIDELARRWRATYWKQQLGAEVAAVGILDVDADGSCREVLLVKPQSFMNTSGGPISKLAAAYDIEPSELLVIHDELDIPAGDVRVKIGGGHAGHNGLRSIIDKLGSRDFARVRVGIGKPPGRMDTADFVLRRFRPREAEEFAIETAQAADVAALALTHGAIFARDHKNGGAARNGSHGEI